jgi:HEAT repeats
MATELQTKHRDVGLILKDLIKVIKVVSLYPEDNPLPISLRQSFSEKLVDIAHDNGGIRIEVERDRLKYEGQVVYQDRNKEDALAGLFFDNGVTSFTISADIDPVALFALLEVFKQYHNTQDADLTVLLWEANVPGFSFGTIEDKRLSKYEDGIGAHISSATDSDSGKIRGPFGYEGEDAYNAMFTEGLERNSISLTDTPGDGIFIDSQNQGNDSGPFTAESSSSPSSDQSDIFSSSPSESGKIHVEEFAKAFGYDDLKPSALTQVSRPKHTDTALILNDEFKLSEEEEYQIGHILTDDASFDAFSSTIELLKELVYQESEMQSFFETITICERIMNEFIVQGRLSAAGQILVFMQTLETELRPKKGVWAERLKEARTAACSRERLKTLATALNKRPEISTGELLRYLQLFGWEAIGGLTDTVAELTNPQHKQTLSDYLVHIGKDKVELLAKNLFDKRADVVANAIYILARIGDNRAFSYLKRVVSHESATVRLTLVNALADCGHDSVVEMLRQSALDKDAEIRRTAIASLLKRNNQMAFDAISSIVNSEHFTTCDQKEQQLLLNAFSESGGANSVKRLSGMITEYNLFNDGNMNFLRQAAFEALCHNHSEEADRLLVSLSRNWRPEIKSMAEDAILRRKEILFGVSQ